MTGVVDGDAAIVLVEPAPWLHNCALSVFSSMRLTDFLRVHRVKDKWPGFGVLGWVTSRPSW